jgi:uncharacterized protein YjiS (DUF1127 family)
MISSTLAHSAAAQSWPATLLRHARAAVESIVVAGRAMQRWRHQRAVHRALLQLDERTLRDLGLHRSELRSLVNGREVTDWLDS